MAITTKFWTWTQILSKVKSELDLDEESFMDDTELMECANDAVDEAEAIIHSLYEDYFLMRGTVALVNGTDTYSLPANIYGHKIRGIVYFNGSKNYEVKRIGDWKKFLEYRLARYGSSTSDYRYFIINATAGVPQLCLSPPAYETGTYLEVWYLRQANRFTTGADACDIPEFVSYVFDFMRERVAFKEAAGSPRHQAALANLDKTRSGMTATLTEMVPDGDNVIVPDLSSYEEMV